MLPLQPVAISRYQVDKAVAVAFFSVDTACHFMQTAVLLLFIVIPSRFYPLTNSQNVCLTFPEKRIIMFCIGLPYKMATLFQVIESCVPCIDVSVEVRF